MARFPHLELKKIDGLHKPKQGGPREIDPTTKIILITKRIRAHTLSRVDGLLNIGKIIFGLAKRLIYLSYLTLILYQFLQIDTKNVTLSH